MNAISDLPGQSISTVVPWLEGSPTGLEYTTSIPGTYNLLCKQLTKKSKKQANLITNHIY